jgi:hypothetical protein
MFSNPQSDRQYSIASQAKSDLQTALAAIGPGIDLTVKWSTGNGKL